MKNNTVKTVLWGLVAAACVLTADLAKAEHGFDGGRGPGERHHGAPGHPDMPRPPACLPLLSLLVPPIFAPPPAPVCVRPYAPPAVYAPAPVVAAPGGYWQEREERIWIEGYWTEGADAYGRRIRMWQPGHWEVRRTREWVQQ